MQRAGKHPGHLSSLETNTAKKNIHIQTCSINTNLFLTAPSTVTKESLLGHFAVKLYSKWTCDILKQNPLLAY